MKIRWFVIAAMVLSLIGLGVPRSAEAVTCIPLPAVVAKMDVIVRGKIVAIPSNGVLELSVTRHYKGEIGPPQMRGAVTGLGQGQRMDWDRVPKVGDELIIGFVKQGDSLVNDICNLFVQLEGSRETPQELETYLGEGPAPVGGARLEPQSRNTVLWAVGGGLMVVGLASWILWRRRRHAT